MRKLALTAGAIMWLTLLITSAYASPTPEVWLLNQKNPDGSFGTYSDTFETALAALALKNTDYNVSKAAEWLIGRQLNGTWRGRSDIQATSLSLLAAGEMLPQDIVEQSVLFLQNSLGNAPSVEDAAWAVIALSSLNVSPESGVALLLSAQNSDGGFGYKAGEESYPWETALAAWALYEAGETTASQRAIAWLERHQYSDGSWGYISDTALAVVALSKAGGNQSVIEAGRKFLREAQLEDGSYSLGGSVSSVFQTALVLLAMPENTGAREWLIGHQNPDGGWSTKKKSLTYETSQAIISLKTRGISSPDSVSWLLSQELDTVSEVSNALLASDQGAASLVDYLLSSQNPDGGFGYAKGFQSNPLDTAYALQALSSRGYDTNSAALYLLAAQSADGSWNGDIYTTAIALNALKRVYRGGEINRAEEYLLKYVDENGTWGGSIIATSLAVVALGGRAPSESYNWLLSVQNPDGGYGAVPGYPSDVLSTAHALRVPMVDLTLNSSDINFSSLLPTEGDRVTITATVHNTGATNVTNVTVAFYDETANRTLIGTDVVSVLANSSTSASVVWDANAGLRRILVAIDPENEVGESNESNNEASRTIFVNSAPIVEVVYPNGGEYLSGNVTVSWAAYDADNDTLNQSIYYSTNGSWMLLAEGIIDATEYVWNTLQVPDGVYSLLVEVSDGHVVRNDTSDSGFTIDNTPPAIVPQYPEIVPDYAQFMIKASITDANLANVTFLQDSQPINYTRDNDTFTSACLGPFSRGTTLSYAITAEDRAGNVATEVFNISIVEGEVKIEGQGKLKNESRSIKLEIEVKWKKGEAKGELELKEKVSEKDEDEEEHEKEDESEERFRAHGKIDHMYRDCSGTFRISGLAKVEIGKGKNRTKEKDVPFTGSIAEGEVRIFIQGREFTVPAKVKIKEKVKEEEDHHEKSGKAEDEDGKDDDSDEGMNSEDKSEDSESHSADKGKNKGKTDEKKKGKKEK